MAKKEGGYFYSRRWFDFAFENQGMVTANHTALYLWIVEVNNRLGWAKEFQMTAKECLMGMCCKSHNTYIKCLNDLIEWGFIKLIRKAINQFQCNIIALSKNDEAPYKALDKALLKHSIKHQRSTVQSTPQSTVQSTPQSNDSILKPLNHKPQTAISILSLFDGFNFEGYEDVKDLALRLAKKIDDTFPKVMQMKTPFTPKQICDILKEYDPKVIIDILLAMQNWQKLLKNNESAYLTFVSWERKKQANV